MKFYTSREKALESLEIFVNKDIVNYSSKRNYDCGPIDRKNVSCLLQRIVKTLKNLFKKYLP